MTDAVVNTDPWTIRRVLTWASDDFKKRGFESPRLEAEILLGSILGVDRVRLIVDATRPLSDDELGAYRSVIQRRREGEPSAYILNQREFFGREFYVDSRVLVPRPDTETLVEVALHRTRHRYLDGRALDLCTGSGCVALSFALERRTWKVTATDLSEEALRVARKNALRLGALWGVRFLPGDLFGAVLEEERFELITANPPYISPSEIETLDRGVRDFEPRLALDGGRMGLEFYPKIAAGALRQLVPGGVLAIEVGAGQASSVAEILTGLGYEALETAKDYGGHERVVSARRPTRPR